MKNNITGTEGIDYINVYSRSNLEIGRWLSNFQKINIKIDDKYVSSIEGYWYYLLTDKSYLLRLHGFSAKKYGMQEPVINSIDDTFKDKIRFAIDTKIKHDLDSFFKILNYNINIPLVHFYETDRDRILPHQWVIDHWEKRRKQLYKKYG